ncbi:class I SAM-dependent methyltransferase [Rhodanobacter aciditrophus]|uniref:class I SAM-dependent methyltransferase n=1 Tax=Rhodanobacter aciditrophus TaxID=1623218 RepID=UPI003CE99F36
MLDNIRGVERKHANSKPHFGIDAPGLVLGFAAGGPLLLLASLLHGVVPPLAWTMRCTGLVMCGEAILMTLGSLHGKRRVVRDMIDSLQLHGDEQVLDVGCGRGLLLLAAARHLPRGRATGIDLWSTRDQGGNAVAQRNAWLAGVAGRVRTDTGDMRHLPYADASFDVVVSGLAIHNLPTETEREQAVREIARVLKPGGQVALLDVRCTALYAQTLREAGLDVRRSWPEFRMFPWARIVRGRKG